MVGKHNYDFQLIIRLNEDLQPSVTSLVRKRDAAGDGFSNDDTQLVDVLRIPDDNRNAISGSKERRLTNESRIYLVGHGCPEASHIGLTTAGLGFTADATAALLRSLIPDGVKVRRVVVHACWGGGNRFGDHYNNQGQVVPGGPTVEAAGSFALALYRRIHDIAASVTARNASTSHGEKIVGQGRHSYTRNAQGEWTHQDPGSKVMFHGMQESGAYSIQRTYGA